MSIKTIHFFTNALHDHWKYLSLSPEKIEKEILTFFLNSRNFNGIPALRIANHNCPHITSPNGNINELSTEELLFVARDSVDPNSKCYKRLINILKALITSEKITVVFDENPHIKRYPDRPIEDQLKYLDEHFNEVCLYPTRKIIELSIPKTDFEELPFKRKLLLSEPQIYPLYFELQILEYYANDPRFLFRFKDYTGGIFIKDKHYEDETTLQRDKIFIEHFGIGYRKSDKKRVAVAWPCDLAKLSSEHQRRWESFIVHDECLMDPDFYENQIRGQWTSSVSIYSALLKELEVINIFCEKIGWSPLFKDIFNERPSHFRMPFLSTSEQYYKFVGVLDKILSENINKMFFNQFLTPEEQIEIVPHITTGLESVRDYGTVKLLQVWLSKTIVIPENNNQNFLKIFSILKKIRSHRSKEAHKIQENLHGIEYDKMHDQIVNEAYFAIRTLRLVLSNHMIINPIVKTLVPDWLFEGKIRKFYFYKLISEEEI